ncbi:hypothetical protein OEZ86_004564 [Tetradesmus obliquus]|nr:hypothetical protein OEZ86_004564 [Tetradesmus obliquus]
MNDSDTANSRGGSSSNESSSTSDCGSEHSSGSAAADRKRRRSVSKGRKPTAAQGSKRSKRPANSRADAVSESAVEPPASPRRRARLQVVELPEGVMRVGGMACVPSLSAHTTTPVVPKAFVAKCFPELQQQHGQQQQVQLRCTVEPQPGADSGLAGEGEATAATISCVRDRSWLRFHLVGAGPLLRRYDNHTVTGMSCVKGSTQLTLHLQPPAAAAAAKRAAEAAAAAAEADPARWQEHEKDGGFSCHKHDGSCGSYMRFLVPPTLLASAFGGAWQQPGFKVQLSVHKDGDCIAGGPGDRVQRSLGKVNGSEKLSLNVPAAILPQLSGCRLTKIRAAPPNYLQAHFTSDARSNTAERKRQGATETAERRRRAVFKNVSGSDNSATPRAKRCTS